MVEYTHFSPVDGLCHGIVVHSYGLVQPAGQRHMVVAKGFGVHTKDRPRPERFTAGNEEEGILMNTCRTPRCAYPIFCGGGCFKERQTSKQTDKQLVRERERESYRQANDQRDRDRQAETERDRQRESDGKKAETHIT